MPVSYRLFEDPLTDWFVGRGTEVLIYQPGGYLGQPPIGRQIQVGGSMIVYRIEEKRPDDLIVVLLERVGERSGLKSPFADFARFIALVKRADVGIVTIRGHVDVLSRLPEDHTEADRIGAFYRKYLAATHLYEENGVEWVEGHLPTHRPPLRSGEEVLKDSEEKN